MIQLFTANTLTLAAAGCAVLVLLVYAFRSRRTTRQLMTTIDNMPQGLCMFDAAGRIVVRNRTYLAMYDLTPEVVKPGCALRDLIQHRKETGHFKGDIEQYVRNILDSVAKGKPFTWTVEANDGRLVNVVNQPMADGGWVATHEDITEQRKLEKQREAMMAQEDRRTAIEAAIRSFRDRVESVLKSVGDNAVTMKATAGKLLAASDQTSQRAESAVQASNEASTNVTTAATATDELSNSIGEIARQLDQTTEVVRMAASRSGNHQRADHRPCRCGAEDRRRGRADPQHRGPDQPAGAQRHDRGGARRRGGPRLCGGRVRGEVARGADRQGDRGHLGADPLGAGIDRLGGRRDPADHRAHARDRPLRLRGGGLGRSAEGRDVGNLQQRVERRARHQRVVSVLSQVAGAAGETRRRRETVLETSGAVDRRSPTCAKRSRGSWRSRA